MRPGTMTGRGDLPANLVGFTGQYLNPFTVCFDHNAPELRRDLDVRQFTLVKRKRTTAPPDGG